MNFFRGNNENYFKLLTASVETLFTNCDENDYDVRLAADENISKIVKVITDEKSFRFFFLLLLMIIFTES